MTVLESPGGAEGDEPGNSGASLACGVLIPVKAFAEAKVRLASALDTASRAELARRMAEVVIAAAAPLPVAVVCDDPDVAEWARSRGAEVFWRPERGLNAAVADGVLPPIEKTAATSRAS